MSRNHIALAENEQRDHNDIRKAKRASIQKAYFLRNPDKKAKGGKKKSKFERHEFIAIDGEGEDYGPQITTPSKTGNTYSYRKHKYTVIAAYDQASDTHYTLHGNSHNNRDRLGTVDCLNFLFDVRSKHPNGIMVCYGASYDVEMIFGDCDYATMKSICKSTRDKPARYSVGGVLYQIYYQKRKCLHVERFDDGKFYDPINKCKLKPDANFQLWDVIGFFQCSFVSAMNSWLGKSHAAFQHIESMKGMRNQFEMTNFEAIIAYNACENEALAEIMNKLVMALQHPEVDLTLQRWDGAGAVAGALYKKHDTKQYKRDTEKTDPQVYTAARYAYSGGHIECIKVGYEARTIHHYDINSAYPSIIRDLPDLSAGAWVHGVGGVPPGGFTVVRVRWQWRAGHPFYPLFWRGRDGSIVYPRTGQGWYWFPEYQTALDFSNRGGSDAYQVLEWLHWKPDHPDLKPFAWVGQLYDARAALKLLAKLDPLGQAGAAQIIIKLGLNSLYGKMCQQLGYNYDRKGKLVKPPFFQLEWAGYVTSATRAKLMSAALQKPGASIAFATDGIYSLEPLGLDCSTKLGAWDYNEHSAMCIVMPGVYAHEDHGTGWKSYSRGFQKEEQETDTAIYREAWKRRESALPVVQRRLIGSKQAVMGNKPGTMWQMRGCFTSSERDLNLTGENSKRMPLKPGAKPWLRLEPTEPKQHEGVARYDADVIEWTKPSDLFRMSRMHDIKWKLQLSPDEMEQADEWEAAEFEAVE